MRSYSSLRSTSGARATTSNPTSGLAWGGWKQWHRSRRLIEADAIAGGRRRRLQQLADRFEHRGDAFVVRSAFLELGHPGCELRVIHEQLAHPNERPHDRDVDLGGAR